MKRISLLLACLLSSSFIFGSQDKKQEHEKIQYNSSNTPYMQPHIFENIHRAESNNVAIDPTANLIKQQQRNTHTAELADWQKEQYISSIKNTFLTHTMYAQQSITQRMQEHINRIKDWSPAQIIQQKELYLKELFQVKYKHNKLFDKIHNKTKMMLEVEAKTNTEHAAQLMEAHVSKQANRTICYQEASMIKDLKLRIEILDHLINDCDQRIKSLRATIIQEFQPIIEKISTEALITQESPALEKKLLATSLKINENQKNQAALAKYRNEYFVLMTQQEYVVGTITARQTNQKLKDLSILNQSLKQEPSLAYQPLLKVINATLQEKAACWYHINQSLTPQAKDIIRRIGNNPNEYDTRVGVDQLQAYLWDQANAQFNAVVTLYAQGSADARINNYINTMASAYCTTIRTIRAGTRLEAVAAHNAHGILHKTTHLAIDPTATIPQAQLDMVLTPATQLASAGFNTVKTGNIEHSTAIADVAHSILDYAKTFAPRLDEISKNIAAANAALAKGLAQGAAQGLENSIQAVMHPLDFTKKALQHGVQLAHALGEVESLNALTINDKATIEKIVTHGTAFTKTLQEEALQFKALTLTQQAEKIGVFIGQNATETVAFEKACSALHAATKLAVGKTVSLLNKCGTIESAVAIQKNITKVEGELVAVFDIKNRDLLPDIKVAAEANPVVRSLDVKVGAETNSCVKNVDGISFNQYIESLMRDPSHGNKISINSMEEAIAGIMAEKQGLLAGPLKRDLTGAAEFIDKVGRKWDVKKAISRTTNGKYIFNPEHLLSKIKGDLAVGENVILDMIKLDSKDIPILYAQVIQKLTKEEIARIIVVIRDETLNSIR